MDQRAPGSFRRGAVRKLRTILCRFILAASLAGIGCNEQPTSATTSLREPDVRYEPTSPDVVQVMFASRQRQSG